MAQKKVSSPLRNTKKPVTKPPRSSRKPPEVENRKSEIFQHYNLFIISNKKPPSLTHLLLNPYPTLTYPLEMKELGGCTLLLN